MSDSYSTSVPLVLPTTSNHELFVHVATPVGRNEHDVKSNRSAEPVSQQTCAHYFAFKAWVDQGITAVLMIAALPLMVLIALAILVLDGRPVFYRQVRVGKDKKQFRIWKFRTMCRNAESSSGAVWSSAGDPRVTRLGRWLRCSHLDELPQFFNVLAGHMNLIGPRPERPEFVRELAAELPEYLQRLQVRPGITGLAQLRLGYDQSVSDVEKKVRLDLEYIATTSLLKDLGILLQTLPYIAGQLNHKRKQAGQRAEAKDAVAPPQPAAVLQEQTSRSSPLAEKSHPDSRALVLPFPNLNAEASLGNAAAYSVSGPFGMNANLRTADRCS